MTLLLLLLENPFVRKEIFFPICPSYYAIAWNHESKSSLAFRYFDRVIVLISAKSFVFIDSVKFNGRRLHIFGDGT